MQGEYLSLSVILGFHLLVIIDLFMALAFIGKEIFVSNYLRASLLIMLTIFIFKAWANVGILGVIGIFSLDFSYGNLGQECH